MIIACAPDRRYSELAGVMLASLVANGDIGDARIFIFGFGLRRREKQMLRASCGPAADRLTFFDIPENEPTLRWLSLLKPRDHPAIFVRVLVPAILADETDRLLYLDCDVLVLSPIRPLAELDLAGHPVAAAVDMVDTHPANDKSGKRIPFPGTSAYFNSGVMLIDLAKWRAERVSERVYDLFEREHRRLGWGDQDALNVVLRDNWTPLDPTWNVFSATAEAIGSFDNARIIHYTTPLKPWARDCTHPRRDLYLHYREQTPWRSQPLETERDRRRRRWLGKRRKQLRRYWRWLTRQPKPAPLRPPETFAP